MGETDRILNDIRTYMRISAAAASRAIAATVLNTQEKARVYDKMDGKTTQAKIESATGVPNQTVSRWVDEFVEAGLASPPNEYYQGHKALFSLAELGISLSVLKRRAKASVTETTADTRANSLTTGQNEENTSA